MEASIDRQSGESTYSENLPGETFDRFINRSFEDEYNNMIFKDQAHRLNDFNQMQTNAEME